MATLRGSLSKAEVDTIAQSKLARYAEGGSRIRPGFELGSIASDFLADGDVQTLRLLLEQDELTGQVREDYALRISARTLSMLDEISERVGTTRIATVRALLAWRRKALEAEAEAAPDGPAPSEFTVTMTYRTDAGGGYEVEVSAADAADAAEAASAAFALMIGHLLDADTRIRRGIKVKKAGGANGGRC